MNIKILPVSSANAIHNQLAAEYDLRQVAIDDGRQNLPAWDAQEYSVTEQRIITDITEAMTQVTDAVRTQYNKANDQLRALGSNLGAPLMGLDEHRLKSDLEALYSEKAAHKHYNEYYKDFKEYEPHWNAFRAQNRITAPANYPASRFNSLTWIAFVIFLEAVANSYLFAKGSDFGLVGGVFQALIVSLLNAGLIGFLMGFVVLPQLNHIESVRKFMGGLGAIVLFIGVILFNLAVGHYRQQLVIGSLDPARDALVTFSANPVALADFEAWLLFMVGVAAFLFSTYKFYRLDDTYPGYGEVDRKYQSLRLRAAQEFDRLHKAAERRLDSEIAALDGVFDGFHRHLVEYSRIVPTLTSSAADGLSDISTLNAAMKTLIKEYQDVNGKVRTTPPCLYWARECDQGQRFLQEAESFFQEAERKALASSEAMKVYKQRVDEEQSQLSLRRKELHAAGIQIIKDGSAGFRAKMDDIFNKDAALKKPLETA